MAHARPNFDLTGLARALGERIVLAKPVASGASSHVWKLEGECRAYALRICGKRANRCPLAVELFVRRSLADQGCAVARPILSVLDCPDLDVPNPWVLDTYVTGWHPQRGTLAPSLAADIGRTLRHLHAIPASQFGVPALSENGSLVGATQDSLVGLKARFDTPLAETAARLDRHPIEQAAPELTSSLACCLDEIRDALAVCTSAVCHSDLHERQFICDDYGLAALIDFGDATLADRRWDLASLFYFHGADALVDCLSGYTDDLELRGSLCADAQLFSVCVALHHGARSRLPGKSHRLAFALGRLREVLRGRTGIC